MPANRFNPDDYYHPNPDRPGSITTRDGHFVKEDVGLFDAPFFGITASEADSMDPQHRWLLEVTYEAFENGLLLLLFSFMGIQLTKSQLGSHLQRLRGVILAGELLPSNPCPISSCTSERKGKRSQLVQTQLCRQF